MIAKIRDVGRGGFGVASGPDGPVMIPHVLAGETVRFRIQRHSHNVYWGEAIEIIHPSAHRVSPPCPLYLECGGCNLQHASPEHQVEIKSGILRRNLRRIAHIIDPPPIAISASPPFHYRTRMVLKIQNGRAGFFQRNSHRVIPVNSCPLMPSVMQERLRELCQYSQIRNIEDGQLVLLSNGEEVAASVADGREWQDLDEPGRIVFHLPDGSFCVNPHNFVQANRFTMASMQAYAHPRSARIHQGVDLYAGAGFLTLSLARACNRKVWAVESDPGNLEMLRHNLAANGLDHVLPLQRKISGRHWPQADFILADPPRKGMPARVLSALASAPPVEMVLFSCDSATFSRDLAFLLKRDFSLVECALIDNFPQSDHIEVIARLQGPV
ncbi:MAG: class I SAM-dependent RNA methyltransferase [Candidatus Aminicenantes bacterium]|nr:class I SAM-dependent RNA methyltransferase [Candidatus Aminicenantes bacterium]